MMKNFLKRFTNAKKGYALPMVLCVLAIGGLTIATSLNYSTTTIKGSRIVRQSLNGIYAADAGVEHALWSIEHGITPLTQLPENINQMTVNINTTSEGTYTLVAGEWVEPNVHSEWLLISTTNMTWDAGANAYKYTVNATYYGAGLCKLMGVGARLPVGYNYRALSASLFGGNLSTSEPNNQLDGSGAHLLSWTFPKVTINPTGTQTFYVTGSGPIENDYGWAVAERTDVGEVGEITGALYKITATAKRVSDNRTTATIIADAIIEGGTVHIASWQVRN